MYRFFRKNRQAVMRYLLIFFLSLIAISMVITLAPIPTGDTTQADSSVLAEIGGAHVTTLDLQRNIQARLRNSPLANDPRFISRMAGTLLDDMILGRALWDQARKLGLEVTDQELQKTIQALPFLYANGTFVGFDRYRDYVYQQTGLTVSEFEAQLRESSLQEKVRNVVTDGVRVTTAEVREEYVRRNTKAKIEYVVFDPSQLVGAVTVTPQPLEAFFKKEAARYKIKEQRRVRYVLIDADRTRAELKLSDEELKQYYGQHLSEYRIPDRVRAAHILFKTEGKKPDEVATLEKSARELLNKIRTGADFAELAMQSSEDSSAQNGGELGWIVRGQTVKEFEATAFSLKPGQVSDLIKTTYGIHIVKVLDKQSAHVQTFEEVKGQIRETLEKQKLADLQQSFANDLHRQLWQTPREFDSTARKAGLEARETQPFRYNQAVPDFGTSESFHNLAFQLRPEEVGTPLSVPKGQAIIQLIEVIPEHAPKLDDVRAAVEQDYRAEHSKTVAAEKAREFAARAKTGDFKKLAAAAGLTVKASNDFTEQDYVEGVGSGSQLAAVFKLRPGQTSDVVEAGTNRVVFRVLTQSPADEAGLAPQRDQIAEQLLERKRALVWEIYRHNLKQELVRTGKLRLHDAAMKRFLQSYERQS